MIEKGNRLFQLLLGAQLVGVTALLLTAVGSTRGEASLIIPAELAIHRHNNVRIYWSIPADNFKVRQTDSGGHGVERT